MGRATKTKPLSFELDEEMMATISREFSPKGIVEKFSQAVTGQATEEIEKIGVEIFREYGKNWMRRSLQLGEEYPDRTYEVLREAADQTGTLTFPLIPQRFIEIAFLSVQGQAELPVIENNARRLIFIVERCRIYDRIRNVCGEEIAQMLICRHGCLEACRTAFNGFGIDIDDLTFAMNATTNKDGLCEFEVRKGSGEFDF
ncbi:MAG: hypothetical protein ABIN58_00680 [candidate division WOR-3 bacterium]